MSVWKRLSTGILRLWRNRNALEEIVTSAADVWNAYKFAAKDGKITTAEYVVIGKKALESAEAAYDLAKKIGWR